MEHSINTATETLSQTISLELVDQTGAATPLQATLSYDPHDPFAVTATFMTGAGNVRWTFGRELLMEGLYEPTGDGDVHVWPCLDSEGNSVVIIELCSPDGEALVQARTADVMPFADRMTASVPPGAESAYLDLDATIAAIFAAEAA